VVAVCVYLSNFVAVLTSSKKFYWESLAILLVGVDCIVGMFVKFYCISFLKNFGYETNANRSTYAKVINQSINQSIENF